MRYTPAALALSCLALVTASASYSAPGSPLDPRAAVLVAQGHGELGAGRVDRAIDFYESALAVQPGSVPIYLSLAEATRRQGMQGKALHYYRSALEQEPQNVQAIAGEGVTLVEKGAVEKARRNLARLASLCGENCDATRHLAAVLAKGPAPRVVTVDAVKPKPMVTEN